MSESVFVFVVFIPLIAVLCLIVIWGCWYGIVKGLVWLLDPCPIDGVENTKIKGIATIFSAITYGMCVVIFTNII